MLKDRVVVHQPDDVIAAYKRELALDSDIALAILVQRIDHAETS